MGMRTTFGPLGLGKLSVAALAFGLVACGGKGKQEDTTPDDTEIVDEGGGQPADDDMVPPEKMDQIQRVLDRRRDMASRCLTDAIEAGEAQKNARGKLTLNFVVQRDGHAAQITVGKSTLKSEAVERCVIELVGAMSFPELPRDLEWSYTYAFEAF